MSHCCPEPGCRRKQPLLFMRAESGFYVVTRWKRNDDHEYTVLEKHRLPDSVQAQLEELVDK